MLLISHRGNIDGPSDLENKPRQVDVCIEEGYDVEIDVRYNLKTKSIWLGHDTPEYKVSWSWLRKRKSKLWLHCKDIETLFYFSKYTKGYNYFWHQNDDFTLTSKKYIWTSPGKSYTEKSIIVMPEWIKPKWNDLKQIKCYGICSDYVKLLT